MKKILIAILIAASAILNPAQVFAADAWAIAAEALGVLAAYKSTLREILALGNNVNAQMEPIKISAKSSLSIQL